MFSLTRSSSSSALMPGSAWRVARAHGPYHLVHVGSADDHCPRAGRAVAEDDARMHVHAQPLLDLPSGSGGPGESMAAEPQRNPENPLTAATREG